LAKSGEESMWGLRRGKGVSMGEEGDQSWA